MKLEDEIKQKYFKTEHQKLFLNIIFTGNWLNNLSIKAFKPYGLSPQQYNVLRILKGQYPNTIMVNQIVERMLDKNSNASRLVDKLVVKGLVNRETCEKDRRQMDVAITIKGLKLLDEIENNMEHINKLNENILSKSDAEQANAILDKIRS